MADNLGTLRDIADFNESTAVTTVTDHRTFNANGAKAWGHSSLLGGWQRVAGGMLRSRSGLGLVH